METEVLNWFSPVFQGTAKAMSILTVGLAVVLTYMLRKTPRIDNSLIVWIVIPAAAFFFTLVGDRALIPDSVPLGNPRTAALAGYGVMLAFIGLLAEAQILNRLLKRIRISGGSDPEAFTKPTEPPKTP